MSMKLTTVRLTLEPLAAKHFESACEFSLDPENARMMCYLPCDDEKEVMDYLVKCGLQWKKEKPEYLETAVMLDDTHIGNVSIEFLENGTIGELGWIINKRYWGHGYAVEAAAALIAYVRKKYGVTHFIGHADAENAASLRAMEKLGMVCTKTYGGRKNRCSQEERTECLYEMDVE